MDTREEGVVVFQRHVQQAKRFGTVTDKSAGFEVMVQLPPLGAQMGEVVVTGRFFGGPPQEFVTGNERAMVKLMEGVRIQLNNASERRKHPRIPTNIPVTIYPLHSDGGVDPPLESRVKDISECGVALLLPGKPPARYGYLSFDAPGAAGMGLLTKFVRSEWQVESMLVGGQYRMDLGGEGA
jgi:hypothetical protein